MTYPDGPHDCEAVAVDSRRRQIVLIAKTVMPLCGVYLVPLPERAEPPSDVDVTAQRACALPMPMVTAMDIDSISGDIWIVSYFQGFRFRCSERAMPVAVQLAGLPEPHEMPRWKQIESIAVDAAGDVWVTSEGSPTPLGRLPQPTGGIARQEPAAP